MSHDLFSQWNLLDILFDRMPMGLAVFDDRAALMRCNPTWASFVQRYTPLSEKEVVAGVRFYDLVPDMEAHARPLIEKALRGESVRLEGAQVISGGIVSYWDMVLNPLLDGGAVKGFVHVLTDATERVIAHQNLERRVEERTREIERRQAVGEGLRDILATLNSRKPLNEILLFIASQAGRLLGTATVAIYRLDTRSGLLSIQASQGLEPEYATKMTIPLGKGAVGRAVQQRRTIAVADMVAVYPKSPARRPDPARHQMLVRLRERYRAILAVPLLVGHEVFGGITLYYPQVRDFSQEEISLAGMVADHAALAIENARLRTQAEEAAVAAERSRLARELHDAVTQTLFSASLIADVIPRIWERNPEEGARRLKEIRQLTRGALAEMRTLLLELRPAALEETNLSDLLQHLAEAATGRGRLPVAVRVEQEGSLPVNVKVTLYRIAQEALNNVVRHAAAERAEIRVACAPAGTSLEVIDDGRGFDPAAIESDHLGLVIMQERAVTVGARFELYSRPGEGTRIRVTWNNERPEWAVAEEVR